MSQAAQKQALQPANDSDYTESSEEDELDSASESSGETRLAEGGDNPIKRTIEEFNGLIDEMDDLREFLRAHGVPLRTTRMIVEFGVQNKPDKQTTAIDSAMEQAEKSFGEGCLERTELENNISTIVNLERDLTHARSVAREEGLDAQALSNLAQIIQQNPGDGGAKAVNTFLGYALAYGIRTDQLKDIVGELTQRPASVLPQIPRKADVAVVMTKKKVVQDVLTGLAIGLVIIWALL